MDLACIVPARGGSKRFPKKNIALLKGKPLLGYAVEAALGSGLFDEVSVSTEDAEIAEVARRFGATVRSRPAQLATDESTVVQVCLDFVASLESEGRPVEELGIVYPTAALITPTDLKDAYRLFRERQADFLWAITSYLEPPFWALHEVDGYLRSFFGDQYIVKSQQLPEVWVDCGYFYLVRVDALRRERGIVGERMVGYRIPRYRSIDIDEPYHLLMAEALLEVKERIEAGEQR